MRPFKEFNGTLFHIVGSRVFVDEHHMKKVEGNVEGIQHQRVCPGHRGPALETRCYAIERHVAPQHYHQPQSLLPSPRAYPRSWCKPYGHSSGDGRLNPRCGLQDRGGTLPTRSLFHEWFRSVGVSRPFFFGEFPTWRDGRASSIAVPRNAFSTVLS